MDHRFKASHRFARIAPRKARYVMDLIRHRPVEEALHILKFTNRRAATLIDKVVRSALANAGEAAVREKRRIEAENLIIADAVVEEGPTMHRWRPRSRGMANPIMRRNCHLVVGLATIEALALEKEKRKGRKAPVVEVKVEDAKDAEAEDAADAEETTADAKAEDKGGETTATEETTDASKGADAADKADDDKKTKTTDDDDAASADSKD